MNKSANINKDFWNERGSKYNYFTAGSPYNENDYSNEIRARYRTRTEFNHIKRIISLKDKKVLDLGCGTGRMTFEFAKLCKKVVGVDFSENLLHIAKNYRDKNNVKNADFILSDLENYRTDEKFDVIFMGGVLMCIENKNIPLIIKKISNFLEQEGIVITRDTISLTEPFGSEDIGRKDRSYYRTIEDYLEFFKTNFSSFYISETYSFVPILNLYNRLNDSLRKNKLVLKILDINLKLQSSLLDPFLLKNRKLYRRQYKKWKTRQFYFFYTFKEDAEEL